MGARPRAADTNASTPTGRSKTRYLHVDRRAARAKNLSRPLVCRPSLSVPAKTKNQKAEAPQRSRTRWACLALLLLAAGVAAASWLVARGAAQRHAVAGPIPCGCGSGAHGRRRKQVLSLRSFNGLGTAQATNTVTVRSRVDGQRGRVSRCSRLGYAIRVGCSSVRR
jgi:hypothetical protein